MLKKLILRTEDPQIWRNLIFYSILSLFLIGCGEENDFSMPNIAEENSIYISSFDVTEDVAKKIAFGFFANDSNYVMGRKGKTAPKIRNVTKVSLEDSVDFEAYVINGSDGFVMIAGDSRVMPIMAYSPEGELKQEYFQEVNGLKV